MIILGFKLSNRTFSTLVMRFSNKSGEVEFSDFMLCAIKLKTMLGKSIFVVLKTRFYNKAVRYSTVILCWWLLLSKKGLQIPKE